MTDGYSTGPLDLRARLAAAAKAVADERDAEPRAGWARAGHERPSGSGSAGPAPYPESSPSRPLPPPPAASAYPPPPPPPPPRGAYAPPAYAPPGHGPRPGDSPGRPWSIAGLVCGVLAILIVPIILGPLGIGFGFVGNSKGDRMGFWVGIGSIFTTVLGMVLGVLIVNSLESSLAPVG